MSLEALQQVLANNLGNRITPELITGLLAGYQAAQVNPVNLENIPPEEFGGAVFHVERLRDILEEINPLFRKHWDETEVHRHSMDLFPDYNRALFNEDRGHMILFTVRKDGELIGNAMISLGQDLYTQRLVAIQDIVFILPEYRRGRLGIRLIKYVEQVLKQIGVVQLDAAVKTLNDVGALLQHLGYRHTANQLSKIL